jgi:two-component system, OmpR family, phosphate regulon response regulator PhoB
MSQQRDAARSASDARDVAGDGVRGSGSREGGGGAGGRTLEWRSLSVDLDRLRVTIHGRQVRLSGFQLKLLLHFLAYPERVFSREQLLRAVWTSSRDGQPQNVDVAICRLRKALGPWGRQIESVKYFGYRLGSDSSSEPN